MLKADARRALGQELLPRASLVTPNIPEAEWLLGRRIVNEDDLSDACHELVRTFGCPALLKGGHLLRSTMATDVFYDGRTKLRLRAPFVRGVVTHGTGCTYSAAIAAYCALGDALPDAVRRAKRFVTRAIRDSARIGLHFVLGWR